jgi:hypothetical protein
VGLRSRHEMSKADIVTAFSALLDTACRATATLDGGALKLAGFISV